MTEETMKKLLACVLILAASAAVGVSGATAQQYPTRPIKILIPIPPGGAPDIAARILGEKLHESLGQPIVVENRAGSNGIIATEMLAKAPADGYTLALIADSQVVINPHLYPKMSVDTLKDIVPVATVAANEFVLSVNPALPARTFQEFIELARKANPPLAYASGGNGSQHHLSMEMLRQRAKIELTHVPYRGGAPATTATVSGEVAAMFAGSSTAPQIRAGNLRALAVTGEQRSKMFPELPTIGEFYPGYSNSIWLALFAPAGTPEPILARLHGEVTKILEQGDVKDKYNKAGGLDPYTSSRESFAARIREDYAKFGKLVKEVGITVD
jgi:tripartite-type tricarboxylate transporter receptor subunit TctC